MAKIFQPLGKTRVAQNASQTQSFPVANTNLASGIDNVFTTHAAGTYSKLFINVVANDRAASSFKFRKNGADGNQVISITGSTTGDFEDTSNSDAVVDGDEINLRTSTGAGGTTFIASAARILFEATTNTVNKVGSTDNDSLATASTTRFFAIGGRFSLGSTTATPEQMAAKTAGTMKKLLIRVSTNNRSTDTTVGLYIGSGIGNSVITIAGAATGIFEDTVNTDSISIDDLLCFYVTTGTGTGNFRMNVILIDYETTNDKWQIFAGQSGANVEGTYAANTTFFQPLGGQLTNDFSTEAETQITPGIPFTASNLQVRVATNTVTADTLIRLRINGVDSNQLITIPSGATGLFEATGSDAISATDRIDYSIVTGATGTSIILTAVSLLASSKDSSNFFLALM